MKIKLVLIAIVSLLLTACGSSSSTSKTDGLAGYWSGSMNSDGAIDSENNEEVHFIFEFEKEFYVGRNYTKNEPSYLGAYLASIESSVTKLSCSNVREP